MNNAALEKLIWVLLYGGLLVVCLGLFVQRRDGDFGVTLMAGGAMSASIGAFLIWLRSRRGP